MRKAGIEQKVINTTVDNLNEAYGKSELRLKTLKERMAELYAKTKDTASATSDVNSNMGEVVNTIGLAVGRAADLEAGLRKAGLAFSDAMRSLAVAQGSLNPLQAEYESIQEGMEVVSKKIAEMGSSQTPLTEKEQVALANLYTEAANYATKMEEFQKKVIEVSNDQLVKQQEINFEQQKYAALKAGTYNADKMHIQELKEKLKLEKQIAAADGVIDEDEKLNILRLENQLYETQNKLIKANTKSSEKLVKVRRMGIKTLEEQVEEDLTGAFDNFFGSLMSGTQSWGDAFKMLLADILQRLMEIYLIQNISESIGGSLGGLFTGGGSITTHATGAVISGATPFLHRGGVGVMGEAGAEAIMPLTRLPNGDLGVQAESSGGVNVVVNNYSGAEVETNYDERTRTVELTINKIATDIMRGIGPVGQAMESRYGVMKR
jgi:phage-related minor tail protein